MTKEQQTPEERKKDWNNALAGVFKGYSLRTTSPELVELRNLELRDGQTKDFWIFGAFGEEGDEYKPEILVIMSADRHIRLLARAIWNDDWPEVVDTDAVTGEIVIKSRSVELNGLRGDELFDVVNKLALGLRFAGKN